MHVGAQALRTPVALVFGAIAVLAVVAVPVLLGCKEPELGVAAERAYPGPLE